MKRILLLSMVFLFVFATSAWAQRTVSGKVTDDTGEGLPGVNVVIKGTTTGVTTDLDGNFQISVPDDNTVLVFTSVGMMAQEVTVGAQSSISVSLSTDVTELQEVVVTALGSDRNAREVVYANQTVKGDELLSTPNKNALEALRGKTAGVKLSTASGSVGASTRIVLRGESSITNNNNALIVVDGIVIDNSTTSGGAGASTTGYADHGNRFNDINPDDIESVTILKGPSATSLYGSRGAAGVVVITTKKGATGAGTMQVALNSSYSQERAYVIIKRQDRFGQGYDNAHFDSGENWAWGPAFDGVVRPWTSAVDTDGDGSLEALTRPYSAVPNQIEEFFNTGHTFTNSVSVSGSNNAFTYYGSYSNTNQTGILENTFYKRNTLMFSASAKLSEKLSSDFKVSYSQVNQNTAQEGSRAFEGNNAYAMVLQSPNNIPFGELRDYKNPYHDIHGYWGSYSSVNPYYILNEYGNEGDISNFLGNVSLKYNIMEGLNIVGRFGANVINTSVETWTPRFTPDTQRFWGDDLALGTRNSKHSSIGDYAYYNKQSIISDNTVLLNYSKALTGDLQLEVTAGTNVYEVQYKSVNATTVGGLLVDGWYNLTNSAEQAQSSQYIYHTRLVGALGTARFGFKDAVFLEYSVRRDWSSTLPAGNNGFTYHAVGGSVVINDLVEMNDNILSFVKIRGSYGGTGRDAPAYQLQSGYGINPAIITGNHQLYFPINGQPGASVGNFIGNPSLTPEKTISFEVGADLGLLDERINIAYTYYSSNHENQIINYSLAASTGYTSAVGNIGLMTNKGHELALSVKPVYGLVQGLDVELFGTWSKNVNEVVAISPQTDELAFGTFTGVTVVAKEGLPMGTYKALAPLTNEDGQVVVDDNTGMPLYTDEEVYLGSYQPDWLASWGANVNYKGIGLNILFDMKQGGQFVSQSKFFTEFNGTALHTAENDREEFVIPNSVIDNGDGTYTENTIAITDQDYYTNYDPAASTYLVDASFIKLREVGLSYTLPKQLIESTPFKSARVAVFGKNLKYWLPKGNAFSDPEVNGPSLTGNAQGIETTQTPSARSFGASLQLTF